MATLVLTAVGSLIGGPIGAAIGAQVGAFIDRQIFATHNTVEGPRLEDLNVTVSTYGLPIPKIFGPENRAGGNIIWSTGLKETEKREKQSAGGKGGGSSTTSVTYTYSASFAVSLGRGPIRGIGRIWADSKLIADFRDQLPTMAAPGYAWPFVAPPDSNSRYSSLTIYNGNQTQSPNSTIEADKGAGNVPGFRGTAYVVFDTLQLADFGNRIPNLTFEVLGGWDATVGDVISEYCERAGLTGRYNTRGLTDNVRGYVDVSNGSARDAINSISGIYDVDVSEINGELWFLPKDRFPFARVPSKYLGAYEESSQPPTQRIVSLANEIDLPNIVEMTHRDPARDYQANTQRARRQVRKSDGSVTIRSDITMPAEQARFRAETKLRRAWQTRRSFQFALPVDYQQVVAGDSLVAEDRSGNEFTVRIINAKKTGLITEIEGTSHYIEFEHFNPVSNVPVRSIVNIGATVVTGLIMDLPPLRDADNDSGVYLAAGADSSAWRGASLLVSVDGGATYQDVKNFPGNAMTGETVSAMFNGPLDYWDTNNYVDVVMDSSSYQLETLTEAAVLNGLNSLFVNGEIIQFRTATLIGGTTYRLTNLLRGRRGTEWKMAAHASGSPVVLLTGGAIDRTSLELSQIGSARLYKVVPNGVDPADVTPVSFTYNANSLRPLSPCHVKGRRDLTTFDWTIEWKRRTRIGGSWEDGHDVPLGENAEKYEVDIMNGGTVVRTITGLTSPTFTYPSAQQVTDFGSNQATLTVRVYQISDLVGRGQMKQENLTNA
jgi:hypothetical protein